MCVFNGLFEERLVLGAMFLMLVLSNMGFSNSSIELTNGRVSRPTNLLFSLWVESFGMSTEEISLLVV